MNKTKPCYLLIRGLLREQRHWGDFVPTLQQQFSDCRIITLDFPGNGELNHLTSPQQIADYTEALRQQMESKQNIRLIAISLGGMIALDWMTRYKDEIESTVLINTSVRPYSRFYQRLRWQVYPKIFTMLLQSAQIREQKILQLTSNLYPQQNKLLKQWVAWQQQKPVSATNALRQIKAAANFYLNNRPTQPILILSSKQDRLVDYHCSLNLHKAWNTAYQQHPNAGHDLPLDDPRWLTENIALWQQELSAQKT